MRMLIVWELVTLDGVLEGPGGEPTHPHTDRVMDYFGPEQEQYKFREVLDADVLLVGRVIYESFAGAWPNDEGPFADRMNGMRKVVVSSTLTGPAWNNTTVMGGDAVAGVRALKAEAEDGPIPVNGSRTLLHTLLDADLIDELRLQVFPGHRRWWPAGLHGLQDEDALAAGRQPHPYLRRTGRYLPRGVALDI